MSTRGRIIGAVLLLLAIWRMVGVASTANGQEGFQFFDCRISGDGILGTLIVFPTPNRGEDRVEIERNGQVLVSTGLTSDHQLAHDGEPYRAYQGDQLVREGIGKGTGCTNPPPPPPPPVTTTTMLSEPTTTTLLEACDDVCHPPTTTTEPPEVTTTTAFVPNQPGPGKENAGHGFAFEREEGG